MRCQCHCRCMPGLQVACVVAGACDGALVVVMFETQMMFLLCELVHEDGVATTPDAHNVDHISGMVMVLMLMMAS